MPQTIVSDKEAITRYRTLLEKVDNELDSMIAEIESETIGNLTEKMPQEILFDVVPLMKKLSGAKKEVEQSLAIYTTKKKLH